MPSVVTIAASPSSSCSRGSLDSMSMPREISSGVTVAAKEISATIEDTSTTVRLCGRK